LFFNGGFAAEAVDQGALIFLGLFIDGLRIKDLPQLANHIAECALVFGMIGQVSEFRWIIFEIEKLRRFVCVIDEFESIIGEKIRTVLAVDGVIFAEDPSILLCGVRQLEQRFAVAVSLGIDPEDVVEGGVNIEEAGWRIANRVFGDSRAG